MNIPKIYSLSTILKGIREHLEDRLRGRYFWLRVEIANINIHTSGHCYLELAETHNGQNIAQCKGVIWKSILGDISNSLSNDFQNILKKGNEILCYVEMEFTEKFGLHINIKDIDITFNLGALEQKKQETIAKLREEGIIDQNKKHILPLVIQKIAVIGSPDTAGITDLIKTLSLNPYQFHFEITTYSCSVQGEKAEAEIILRLQELNASKFDIIALIRGGGSKLDLDLFNSYAIAKEIALHSIPIFTGIGHETDISVADLVANINHKTPSALGSYIVDRAYNFYVRLMATYNNILEYKKHFVEDRKSKLKLTIATFANIAANYTQLRRGELHTTANRISTETRQHLNGEKNKISFANEQIRVNPSAQLTASKSALLHTLELIRVNSSGKIKESLSNFNFTMEYIISYSKNSCAEKLKSISNISQLLISYHPENILNKGYAIPRLKGKLLLDQVLKPTDELELELKSKTILVSYIKTKEK